MKKFLGFIGFLVVFSIIISLIKLYNDSVDEDYRKELQEPDLQKESASGEASEKITVNNIDFECYFLNDNYARIKSDTLILDTAILNKVIRELKIKVSPVYFHSKNLTETGEEYAFAFNGKSTLSDNPPRTKEDVQINTLIANLNSNILDCELIIKDKSITVSSANSYIENVNKAVELYKDKKFNNNKKVSDLKVKLKNRIISAQVYLFPKARKAYVNELSEKMWEENITVTSSGTTITLIGGVFANNKNKKDAIDAMYPTLTKLRFKRANFKWYKYDDEYTYYNIDTPSDKTIQ